jgi:hypothetical protein
MYLIIRGHIRNAFHDEQLLSFIEKLYSIDNSLEIYIHTWNILQNDVSWRNIKSNNTIINVDIINNYFKEFAKLIKNIIIDDDNKILLNGKTNGFVSSGKMPLIGWKNYWYGQYNIINYLKNTKYSNDKTLVINMRFDLFSKPYFLQHLQHKLGETLEFIKTNMNLNINCNKFVFDNEQCNIDNIILGTIESQFKLISKFHFDLDNIINTYGNICNHEKYVFKVNNDL